MEYEDESFMDEYYDNTMEGDEGAFFDEDGLIESLLIVGITMSLVLLIWWRNRIQRGGNNGNQGQDQHQEDVPGQQAQPQQNNGRNPGDLFGAWAANGMGF